MLFSVNDALNFKKPDAQNPAITILIYVMNLIDSLKIEMSQTKNPSNIPKYNGNL